MEQENIQRDNNIEITKKSRGVHFVKAMVAVLIACLSAFVLSPLITSETQAAQNTYSYYGYDSTEAVKSSDAKGYSDGPNFFYIDGKTAYCLNIDDLDPPDESIEKASYSYEGSYKSFSSYKADVAKVLYVGYPNDGIGLQKQNGWSDNDFREATQGAVTYYTNGAEALRGDDNEICRTIRSAATNVSEPESGALKVYTPAENSAWGRYQDLVVPSFEEIVETNEPEKDENIEITEKAGKLTIKKVDEANNPVEGAALEIQDSAGNVIEAFTTTTSGIKEFTTIKPGDYKLVEKEAPAGYEKAEPVLFTVKAGKKTSVNDGKTYKVSYLPINNDFIKGVTNPPLMVVNDDNGVKGAVACIKPVSDGPKAEGTVHSVTSYIASGSNLDIFRNDNPELTDETLDRIKKVLWAGYAHDAVGVKADLGLDKKDFGDATFYAATSLAVEYLARPEVDPYASTRSDAARVKQFIEDYIDKYDDSDTSYGKQRTAYKALLDIAKTGTYKGQEIIVPAGYYMQFYKFDYKISGPEVAEGYQNYVDLELIEEKHEEETVEDVTVIMRDNRVPDKEVKKSKVKIIKTDENKNLISGATLIISTDADGRNIAYGPWVTDGSIKEIELAPGDYYLVETEAPNGYEISQPVRFTVTESKNSSIVKEAAEIPVNNGTTVIKNLYVNGEVIGNGLAATTDGSAPVPAFCLDKNVSHNKGTYNVSDLGSTITFGTQGSIDSLKLMRILYHGYAGDAVGYSKNFTSDEKGSDAFYNATQAAIWHLTNGSNPQPSSYYDSQNLSAYNDVYEKLLSASEDNGIIIPEGTKVKVFTSEPQPESNTKPDLYEMQPIMAATFPVLGEGSEQNATIEVTMIDKKKDVITTETPTSVEFTAKKTLEGADINSDDYKNAFVFELKDKDGTVIQTKNNNGENVGFDVIDINAAGDYEYTVSEKHGDNSNITYSEDIKTVKFTVEVVEETYENVINKKLVIKNVESEEGMGEAASDSNIIGAGTFVNKYKVPEIPEIKTTATDETDGDKQVTAESKARVKDVVKYSNLIAGKTYTMEGQLVKKSDKSVVAEAKTEFTAAEGGAGEVELVFEFDASELAGQSAVAFETAKEGDEVIAIHADLEDEDQTVDIIKPEIGTTATDNADGDKKLKAEKVEVKDVVEYKNLTVGKTYTLTGKLVTKSSNGETVVSEADTTFTPSATSGRVELVFSVDASALKGEELVAFETVTFENKEVAVHADIKDEAQTVEVETDKPLIRTTATDNADGDKKVTAEDKAEVKDVVKYQNLEAGKTYTMEGKLVKKSDESVLAEAKTEFVAAEGGNGEVTLVFTFDASKIAGDKAVVFETAKDGETEVAVHANINDNAQTVDIIKPEVKTTAEDAADHDSILEAAETVTVRDIVKYENLTKGKEYTLKGKLVTKSSNGETVVSEAEKKFTPAAANGEEVLEFTVNTTDLKGERLVVFETVYYNEKEVAVHADIEDADQTVEVENPEIKTTASDAEDGDSVIKAGESVQIKDIVKYTGLTVGKKYTVTGTLHNKKDGSEIKAEVAPVEFTAESKDGEIEMIFTVDARDLAGEEVVVFESLSYEGKEIAVHADINDENQTVTVDKPGSVKISKTDLGGKEIAGAKIVVTDADGNKVEEWTSTKKVKQIELKEGSYTMTETVAPAGYQKITTAIKFDIDAEGKVTLKTATVDGNGKVEVMNGDKIVLKDAPEPGTPDIEKYVNKDVHKDITLDEVFTYDVLAFITRDADKATITDDLVEDLQFVSAESEVNFVDLGESVDHTPNGSVAQTGTKVENAKATIKDRNLTVQIDDATALRGHWVKVTFDAKIADGKTVADLTSATITENTPVISDEEHTGVPNKASYEITVGNEGKYREESNTVTVTPEEPEIGTKATDNKDGDKILEAAETVAVKDVVTYKNLIVGKTYTLKGALVTKSSKGETVVAENSTEFTPEKKNGSVELVFTVDTSALAGEKLVAFETVSYEGKEVAVHADIEDKAQTVTVEKPGEKPVKISKTTLGGDEIKGATIELKDEKGEVVETWTSTTEAHDLSLAPGKYTFKETVAPAGFKAVTTEITFTVDKDGKVTLETATVDNGAELEVLDTNHIVLKDAPEKGPEIEKYVNKDVHSDITLDEVFTYDVLAYITADADAATITDELVEDLQFVSAASDVKVVDLGTDADHTPNGSVAANGKALRNAASNIEGRKLTVSIADAKALRGHWVKVTFDAKIADGKTVADLTSATITENTPVFSDEEHTGVPNTAKYTITVGNEGKYRDESNTVTVTPEEPEIGTKATDNKDNDKILESAEKVEVKDVVTYKNLTVGKTYTLTGKLVTKSSKGETVVATNETTFTPEKKDGKVELVFTVDTSALAGEKLVAFETVSYEGKEVAVHADIEDKAQTVTVEKPGEKTIKISKVDIAGNEIEGAKIQIICNGEVVESWTSTTEIHDVKLQPGEYTFHEETAPNGYLAVTDITFTVDINGVVKVTSTEAPYAEVDENGVLVITDEYAPYTVNISKADLGGVEVPGATITVSGDSVTETWVSTTEAHSLELKPGNYTLVEEVAPEGYKKINTTIEFKVNPDGTAEIITTEVENGKVGFDENGTLILFDEPEDTTVDVKISKVDIAGNEIEGALIEIRQGDSVVESWTSTTDIHEMKLQPGTYVFHEETAPHGYTAVTDVIFSVDVNGVVTVETVDANYALVDENGVLVITDEYMSYNVSVSKADLNGTELPGAKITVTGNDFAESWVSTDKSHNLILKPGNYTLVEEVAPSGFKKVTTAIEFSVDLDGNVTVLTQTVENGKIAVNDDGTLVLFDEPEDIVYTDIPVTKTWIGRDVDDAAPSSVTVRLLADGVERASAVLTEDTGWTYTFTDLEKYADGKEISYTITEDAVDNYTSEINGYNITNTYTPGNTSVNVVKSWTGDDAAKRPEKIIVDLLADGVKTDSIEVTAGNNWSATFAELPVLNEIGKRISYTVEEQPIEGYTGTVTGSADTGYVINNERIRVDAHISKQAIGGGSELEGATLVVADEDEVEIERWISGTAEHIVEALPTGIYTLTEITAPKGYKIAETINFRVNDDGSIDVQVNGTWTNANGLVVMYDAFIDEEKVHDYVDIPEIPDNKPDVPTPQVTERTDVKPVPETPEKTKNDVQVTPKPDEIQNVTPEPEKNENKVEAPKEIIKETPTPEAEHKKDVPEIEQPAVPVTTRRTVNTLAVVTPSGSNVTASKATNTGDSDSLTLWIVIAAAATAAIAAAGVVIARRKRED